jgi:hypothetical protein
LEMTVTAITLEPTLFKGIFIHCLLWHKCPYIIISRPWLLITLLSPILDVDMLFNWRLQYE